MNFRVNPRAIPFSSGKAVLVLLVLAAGAAQAAPLDDLRSLAQLPPVELAKLKSGEIVSQRGPLGDFSRGISVESCYFIHAPVEKVGNGLLHWDPLRHPGSDVRLYREYALPGTAGVFKKLQLRRGVADDKWLLDQTARAAQTGAAGELHLTKEEVDSVRQKAATPDEAWQEIFGRRSAALARGGLAAVPPYGLDKSISPWSEFRGLLSLAPKAAQHFRPITTARPLVAGGKPASETVAYWEATRVRDHTTLELGLFAAEFVAIGIALAAALMLLSRH